MFHRDDACSSKIVPEKNVRSFSYVTCYRCQELVHYAGKSPSSTSNACVGSQSLQVELTMTQKSYTPVTYIINTNWIILDTCSIITSIRNKDLVHDGCACGARKYFWAYTNGVNQDYNYTATMTMLPFRVFYNKNPLANILSFSAVACNFRISVDAYLYPAINVRLGGGTSIVFKKCSRDLYYYDTTNMEHKNINIQVTDYTFLIPVESNKAYLH